MKFSEIILPDRKLTDYLLSTTHVIGRSKAKFFRMLGFNEENLKYLREQLIKTIQQGLRDEIVTPYGKKIIAENFIETPSGKRVRIKTVWILDMEDKIRFVTAYPV